ncbi:MAG: glycosyltransferase family 2 protein, partial [Planctomycetota bacterium]|nr:glycosyltransferase family 2 protein [Planctomycetota bacterium]
MRYNPVNIVVPAYNDAGVLDATLDSVAAQEYEAKKIFLFIVDFGSTDGTLEKAAARRTEQTAVFRLAGKRVGRTMAADAVRALGSQAMGSRTILLWPGDVMYPHCLRTAEKWMRKRPAGMLIAEADIRDGKGNVRSQTPLFTKPGYIRGFSRDSSEYVRKGWRHAVLRYGGGYLPAHGKIATQRNFDYWWNSLAYHGLFTNAIYVNTPLGCVRERMYADEL